MKALVYGGPGLRRWDLVPDPSIQSQTDVSVKIDTTTSSVT
jgi:alcohol dehydrogenase